MTTEAKVYLPPYTSVTIWHLKDLASKKKTVSKLSLKLFAQKILSDNAKHIAIP